MFVMSEIRIPHLLRNAKNFALRKSMRHYASSVPHRHSCWNAPGRMDRYENVCVPGAAVKVVIDTGYGEAVFVFDLGPWHA